MLYVKVLYMNVLYVLAEVCVMDGKEYTEGQKWFVGCEKICVCDDGKTGLYTCNDRYTPFHFCFPNKIQV